MNSSVSVAVTMAYAPLRKNGGNEKTKKSENVNYEGWDYIDLCSIGDGLKYLPEIDNAEQGEAQQFLTFARRAAVRIMRHPDLSLVETFWRNFYLRLIY